MDRPGFGFIAGAACALLLLSAAFSQTPTEREKIRLLLNALEKSNFTFIRNGTEYPSRKAREHLERKLSAAGNRIVTARQFIKYIASGSSTTGTPYLVKLPNGRTIETSVWLHERLREIESGRMKSP